jgi:hypothetical protein
MLFRRSRGVLKSGYAWPEFRSHTEGRASRDVGSDLQGQRGWGSGPRLAFSRYSRARSHNVRSDVVHMEPAAPIRDRTNKTLNPRAVNNVFLRPIHKTVDIRAQRPDVDTP